MGRKDYEDIVIGVSEGFGLKMMDQCVAYSNVPILYFFRKASFKVKSEIKKYQLNTRSARMLGPSRE